LWYFEVPTRSNTPYAVAMSWHVSNPRFICKKWFLWYPRQSLEICRLNFRTPCIFARTQQEERNIFQEGRRCWRRSSRDFSLSPERPQQKEGPITRLSTIPLYLFNFDWCWKEISRSIIKDNLDCRPKSRKIMFIRSFCIPKKFETRSPFSTLRIGSSVSQDSREGENQASATNSDAWKNNLYY